MGHDHTACITTPTSVSRAGRKEVGSLTESRDLPLRTHFHCEPTHGIVVLRNRADTTVSSLANRFQSLLHDHFSRRPGSSIGQDWSGSVVVTALARLSQRLVIYLHHRGTACPYTRGRRADRCRRTEITWIGTGQGQPPAKGPELCPNSDSTVANCNTSKPRVGGGFGVERFSGEGRTNIAFPAETQKDRLRVYRNLFGDDRTIYLDLSPLQAASLLMVGGISVLAHSFATLCNERERTMSYIVD
jgi:hypothetical protein